MRLLVPVLAVCAILWATTTGAAHRATLVVAAPARAAIVPTSTLAGLRIETPATLTSPTPALRLDPPPPPPSTTTLPAFASDCEEMSWYRQQAGLPPVFDRLGSRESNCRNEEAVHTFCCWGWWQLYVSLHLAGPLADGYHQCGVWSRFDVDSDTPDDKRRQACATKVLYDSEGLAPWNL